MSTETRNWTLKVLPDAPAASKAAADVVTALVQADPEAVISLPTGATPLGMFDVLAGRAERGEIDFSNVSFYCLDEYVGVTVDDPNSLTRWLWEALLHRVNFEPERVHALPSTAANLSAAADEYDNAISARGGLDLAVLGLGPNGHVGYNEPGSSADSRTRVVALTPESIDQGSGYWHGALSIPDRAMTMGVGTLLESKRILLLVTGESKAEILQRTLEGTMTADVPGSWLRMAESRFEVIADQNAASKLSVTHKT